VFQRGHIRIFSGLLGLFWVVLGTTGWVPDNVKDHLMLSAWTYCGFYNSDHEFGAKTVLATDC